MFEALSLQRPKRKYRSWKNVHEYYTKLLHVHRLINKYVPESERESIFDLLKEPPEPQFKDAL
jgi:hypothetical protein